MTTRMRLVAVTLLTALAALTGVGVAGAHSAVTGFSPETGESIATGPERVTVTFNEPLQTSFASLTVVGPDGNLWSTGDPVVEGPTVSVPVGELGPVGEYTIAYRVTSADGHPVSGTSTFTLTTEGTGTPGAAANGGSSTADGEDEGSGVPLWPFIVAAVVVFAGGLAFALRKPKQ